MAVECWFGSLTLCQLLSPPSPELEIFCLLHRAPEETDIVAGRTTETNPEKGSGGEIWKGGGVHVYGVVAKGAVRMFF